MIARSDLPRRGYSLIELMFVVLILALVAASLTFQRTGLLEPARLKRAVGTVIRFDGQIRDMAVANRCLIGIQVGHDGKSLVAVGRSGHPNIRRMQFGKGVSVAHLNVFASREAGNEPVKTVAVFVTRAGTSQEYDLELVSAAERVRLEFSGATGHCTVTELNNP